AMDSASALQAPALAAGPWDASARGQLCDAGQSDAGSGKDASDTLSMPDPRVAVTDREAGPGVSHGGWVYPLVQVQGLDSTDVYGLLVPPQFLDSSTGPFWKLRLEVATLPLVQLNVLVGYFDHGVFVTVGSAPTRLEGGTTRLDLQIPLNARELVLSLTTKRVVGVPPPVACPDAPLTSALGPTGLGGPLGTLVSDSSAGADPAVLLGLLPDYTFKPEGCKPQCLS
ncbi:MAG: hypothetical protein ACRELA_23965, partial [Candidatus Rokuibacteriota bacterium]